MVKDNETINSILEQYITDVRNKMSIDKVYLYGSYAKGTNQEGSDIDICFFSHDFETRRSFDVLAELFFLKTKYDKELLIEPNAFPTSELNNDNPFVKEILRTGREITFQTE
ncbi:MAG: nucleotidyltransferase domain-containing protein [Treponema sp.]|nr:nucleotidyltransferase domain-containing protein [Treponema sp.]